MKPLSIYLQTLVWNSNCRGKLKLELSYIGYSSLPINWELIKLHACTSLSNYQGAARIHYSIDVEIQNFLLYFVFLFFLNILQFTIRPDGE